MAVPRLAEPEPFFALDPDRLSEPPRKAASITGATRSARRVALAQLSPVDLVVMGSVAVGLDGARLGKGGGFAIDCRPQHPARPAPAIHWQDLTEEKIAAIPLLQNTAR